MDVRQQPRPQESAASSVVSRQNTDNTNSSWMGKRLFFVLATILAFMGIVGLASRGYNSVTADHAVNGKEYQALFLTNGQVYFGKLSQTDSNYVKLTSIYYLQVQQQVQPPANSSTSTQSPQVSLAKLGSELHGPEDSMYVAKAQVLFWENLKTDGKVAQAIASYIASQKK